MPTRECMDISFVPLVPALTLHVAVVVIVVSF